MYSQLQPIYTYFEETKATGGNIINTNKNLDFSKSFHIVIGYDVAIKQNMSLSKKRGKQNQNNNPIISY